MRVIALVLVFVVPEEDSGRCAVVVPPPSSASLTPRLPAPAPAPDAAAAERLAIAHRRRAERAELATVRPGRRLAVEVAS